MELNELEAMLPTLTTEQLINVLTDVANTHGVGSLKYFTVTAEIYRRLEGKTDD